MAELTFFFDRCTGTGVPLVLQKAKPWFGIEYHDDKKNGFKQTTRDDEWLAEVAKKGWIVISHDKRFHEDSLALEAVRQHRARVFYMFGGSLPTWDKIRIFAQSFTRIEKLIATQRAPFIYTISQANRITRVAGI